MANLTPDVTHDSRMFRYDAVGYALSAI